jgi:hypothetical protein
LLSSTDIDDDTAAAISEVRKTKDGIAIKFYDKRAALAELGKHLCRKTKLKLSGGYTLEQLIMASFELPGEQVPAALPARHVDKRLGSLIIGKPCSGHWLAGSWVLRLPFGPPS